MKYATLFTVAVLLLAGAASASLPEGKVAVVRVTAINGLAQATGQPQDTRSSVFTYDGTEYTIDRSALASLEGVQTLLLIDHRRDALQAGGYLRQFTQEARAFDSLNFEVTDLPGKVLAYQVAMIGGNLRLLGSGDQIVIRGGGQGGPYHIWKVTGIDLVNKTAVILE